MQTIADDITLVDEAALRILEESGVRIDDEEVRARFARVGCTVKDERVYLTRPFVEAVLEQVPSSFTIFTRDGECPLKIGDAEQTITNGGVMARIYDLETGDLRMATLQDVSKCTRIMDSLPRAAVVCATLVEPTDAPSPLSVIQGFVATLRNTEKPIIGPGPTNATDARWAVSLGASVRGGHKELEARPFFLPWLALSSPLYYPAPMLAAMRVCAQAGLPLAFVTNPITALTGPVTLAGALAQMHAELLGAIVIAHQMRPGLPVLYQGTATMADLRTLAVVKGRPETSLTLAATVLLARNRSIPTTSFGFSTTSKMVDVAYGLEKAMNALTVLAAGPNILSGMGMLASASYASYESLIIDHEIAGMLSRLTQGIRIDDDTLAANVVKDAMDGLDFITHKHTMAHLRTGEYWIPALADCMGLDEWLLAGKPGMLSRARAMAIEAIATHQVAPLPPEIDAAIETTINGATRELLGEDPS